MSSPKKLKKKPVISAFRGNLKNSKELFLVVMSELRKAGYSPEEVKQYCAEASAQGFSQILQVSAKWAELK